jgi:hypothetical protein
MWGRKNILTNFGLQKLIWIENLENVSTDGKDTKTSRNELCRCALDWADTAYSSTDLWTQRWSSRINNKTKFFAYMNNYALPKEYLVPSIIWLSNWLDGYVIKCISPPYPLGHSRQTTVSSTSCVQAPWFGHGQCLQSYAVPCSELP